jgi:hypothetical protein
MMRVGIVQILSLAVLGFLGRPVAGAETTNQLSEFHEVYDLIRENLSTLKPEELDHAAAVGLAAALSPRVWLLTNGAPASEAVSTNGPLIAKAIMYEGQIAYVRITRVADGLPEELKKACQALASTNKLNGVVLDLRFANGDDYAAAAAAADLFIRKEQTLLNWGTGEYHSKLSDDDITLPVAALVNRKTAGAAEALAAIFRQAGAGLILGGKTAGQASVAREFPLKNGDRLEIATARIMLGDGTALTPQGVSPDIAVQVSPADERAYYADAFKVIAKAESSPSLSNLTATNASSATNRTARRPRFNEAELVRERREGVNLDSDLPAEREAEPDKPVVRDPALARALDVLKGLAVVRQAPS